MLRDLRLFGTVKRRLNRDLTAVCRTVEKFLSAIAVREYIKINNCHRLGYGTFRLDINFLSALEQVVQEV